MFIGWFFFNGLLVLLYLGFQRYTQLDTWIWREPVARMITFDTWVVWPDITPPEIQMAGGNHAVQRMDTDGDGFEEWVVKYEYDLATQRSPVAVAIYDNDRGTPPVLYPYRLTLPERDYASETGWRGTQIEIKDFIKGDTTGRPEILVHGNGPPEELALFRYDETRKSPDWMDPRDYPPVYRCIGYFRGDAVFLPDENNDVIVTRRVAYDRSQLAIKERYRYDPVRDTYLDADEKTLMPSVESWVDFAFKEPEDVASSEYSEKIVLAYYKRFPGGDVVPFMSRQAREYVKIADQTHDSGAYGLPVMPDQIERILIQTLAYTPQSENVPYVDYQGITHFGAMVHVEFFYYLKDAPTERRWYSINWFVVQEEGNWRLDHIEP